MPVIRHADSRRTTTPNGTMTTFASPTQGATALSMWRVDAVPGSVGPLHAFDTELIWTITGGVATVDLDGEKHTLTAGDTVVLPAGVARQMHADAEAGFTAVVAATGGAIVSAQGREPLVPDWIV